MASNARPGDTIKVSVARSAPPEVVEAAIAHLVEEWAALTYICMVDAAMAAQADDEPMHPPADEQSLVAVAAAGGGA